MKCPLCEKELTRVGDLWVCPDHKIVGPQENAKEAAAAEGNPRIFLSYARSDDEAFVRRLYDDLTAAGFKVWFDRVSMPSRDLTFHQEIREAVADCQRLVLIVGPGAVSSDYVRQEWQFAWFEFEAEKVVVPILRQGDYPLAIDELKLLHCEDFRDPHGE